MAGCTLRTGVPLFPFPTQRSVERYVECKLEEQNARTDALAATMETRSDCTKLLDGIHVCSTPMYPVMGTNDITLNNLLDSDSNGCILTEDLPVKLRKYRRNDTINHFADLLSGDKAQLPRNYVCFQGSKMKQYHAAIAPITDPYYLQQLSKHGDEPLPLMRGRAVRERKESVSDQLMKKRKLENILK